MLVAVLIIALVIIVGFIVYAVKHNTTLTLGETDKNNFWRLSK